MATLVVGIEIGKACDGCWLNSVQTAEVERGRQKGAETSDVFFFLVNSHLQGNKKTCFRPQCFTTAKGLAALSPRAVSVGVI